MGDRSQFTLQRIGPKEAKEPQKALRQFDKVYIRHKCSSRILHADGLGDGVGVRWKNVGGGKRQTWKELALERTRIHKRAWREFTLERAKRRRFSEEQVKALLLHFTASKSHRRQTAKAGANAIPKRKRDWCSLLLKSASKKQRTQLSL